MCDFLDRGWPSQLEGHARRRSVTKKVRIRLKEIRKHITNTFGSTNHTLTTFEGKVQQQNKNATNNSLQLSCLMQVRKRSVILNDHVRIRM
jgi:hypothetical protein